MNQQSLIHIWWPKIERNEFTFGIFLDLSMAFDTDRSNVTIPTTSFLNVFGEMTSCTVHYGVIYQFSIFKDLRSWQPCTWNVIIVISTQVIAQGYVSENKESRWTKYREEELYNNCFICNLSSYLASIFRIVSIRSRLKLALCLSWPNIIPNGSRRGRIQNRDYQSQNLVNEVTVESHLPILVIDSVKRRRPNLPCFYQFVTGPQGTDGQINEVPDLEEHTVKFRK